MQHSSGKSDPSDLGRALGILFALVFPPLGYLVVGDVRGARRSLLRLAWIPLPIALWLAVAAVLHFTGHWPSPPGPSTVVMRQFTERLVMVILLQASLVFIWLRTVIYAFVEIARFRRPSG